MRQVVPKQSVELDVPPGGAARPRRWVTFRSALLGTAAAVVVCGLTPYNDFVVANTFLVGSYLPVSLVLTFLALALVNAPLHRWAPAHALGAGEMAVIMGMMLVASSLPSQGFLRAFLPMLVGPHHFGSDERFWRVFTSLDLPRWLQPADDRLSLVVSGFYGRLQAEETIPYGAWVVPLAGWGVFIAAVFTALICFGVLAWPQWAINERLPFPLAQLELSLIQPPRPGRMLNDLMGHRLFWVALVAVVVVQSFVPLHRYFPQYVPELPLNYDWRGSVFANPPWSYLGEFVKHNKVFFTFIGVAYFIQSRTSFSLWATYFLLQALSMQARVFQHEIPFGAWQDQHLGACVALVLGTLWVGRKHWWGVLRTLWPRGRRGGAAEGSASERQFVASRAALLALLVSVGVMFGWLRVVGVGTAVAAAIVASILVAHIVASRVVAETGMPSFRAFFTFNQAYAHFPATNFSGREIYFAGATNFMGPFSTREGLLGMAMHGMHVADGTEAPPRQRRWLVGLMAWALLVGFVMAAFSSLKCYYTYAMPLSGRHSTVLNPEGLENIPRRDVVDPLNRWAEGRFPPPQQTPWLHVGVGFVVTAVLHLLSLRFSNWPFLPVGYLGSMVWFVQQAWLSIFLGWLAKLLIVRFGGAAMFQRSRPLFVGLIFGEAVAAGIWMVVTLVLAELGMEYHTVNFLPS